MVEKTDTVSADGVKSDGVSFYPASPEQLQSFNDASEALARFKAPILAHANNPHERIFMAAFDGTGNDADQDPEHATNVDKIRKQVETLTEAGEKQIHVEYLAGPGTQDNKLARIWDGARGHTYEPRIEEMYRRLVEKADEWRQIDPDVEIRVQVIGFSRGASQGAGFTRLLDERGIVDPKSAIERAGPNGEPVIEYTDHLVAPGKTPQTVGLFDPVATGVPMNFDRRLPPSVVSGFQITAADERRGKFPSDRIIPMGFSEDGRFLNVAVAGAHSNNGGGYLRNGVSLRCCNLMVDYLNSGRDTPFLEKYYEPTDPRYAVVHRSEEGMLLYKVDHKINRLEPGGYTEQQQPRSAPDALPFPNRPEAVGPAVHEVPESRPIAIREAPLVPEIALPPIPDAEFTAAPRALGAAEVAKGLGVASAATVLYDTATTAGRVSDLRQQQNETGAQSTILHFEGRNLGALGGAVLGAELFGSGGAETGPLDLFVAAAGAGIGAYYGKKLADEHDQAQIYNQTDPQGISWHYDPKQPEQGWTRDLPPLPETPHGQHFTADPALAERLGFQANNKATELAMTYAPKPEDPYAQPAGKGDTHSVDDARWMRDVASHTWSRQVVDERLEHGLVRSHVEQAPLARAAQLDQAAEQTIFFNLSHTQRAMAEQYQASYEQRDWQQFGAVPDAISRALTMPEDALLASDGHIYNRDTEGHWGTPGRVFGTNLASAHIGQQLDATMAIKQAQETTAQSAENVAQRSSTPSAPSGAESVIARELSPTFRAASETLDRVTTAMESVDRSLLHKEMEAFATSTVGRAFFAQAGITVDKEDVHVTDSNVRDPRDPAHPDHAMTQSIRHQLTALHTEAGIYPSKAQIEPLTAAIALHVRENHMTRVDQLQFNADNTSVLARQDPGVSITEARAYSATPVQQALQTPPEHSYQQMTQVTQQQAQMSQIMQQQAVQSQQQGASMGR